MKLRIAAVLLLPLVSSCKPEESAPLRTDLFAEGCAQLFSCGCAEYPFADAAQCEEVFAVQYAGLAAIADAAGLTVDETCLQEDNPYLQLGCKTISEFIEEPVQEEECNYCTVVHGTVAAGQPCVDYDEISDCAQGLFCADGVCVDPCAKAKLGESCLGFFGECDDGLYCNDESGLCAEEAGLNEPCESTRCADGLTCTSTDFDQPQVCRPLASEGQECFGGSNCAEGLVCDFGSSTCVKPPGAGESCDFSDCADGLACNYDEDTGTGTCGPLPKVGEPCTGRCEGDAVCPFDTSVCTAPPGAGQPCLDYSCATGFECENDVCIEEQALVCE